MTPAPPTPSFEEIGWQQMTVVEFAGPLAHVTIDLGFGVTEERVVAVDDVDLVSEFVADFTARLQPIKLGETWHDLLVLPESQEDARLYVYDIHVVANYDGDTITANIDLTRGHSFTDKRIRLHRIDTWEIRGEERPLGLKAREFTKRELVGRNHLAVSHKDRTGKFGRYLFDIWPTVPGECFNDTLVKLEHASYVDY